MLLQFEPLPCKARLGISARLTEPLREGALMQQVRPGAEPEALVRARDLMRAALGLLDERGAPADIGAHLDLAICRLEAAMEEHPPEAEKGITDGGG